MFRAKRPSGYGDIGMTKLIFLVVLSAFALVLFFSNPLNRVVVFTPIGDATSLRYIFLSEGESLTSARAKLIDLGLTEIGDPPTLRCGNHTNEAADKVILFRDESWRRGVFCVFLRNDEVIDVSWWFDPMAP